MISVWLKNISWGLNVRSFVHLCQIIETIMYVYVSVFHFPANESLHKYLLLDAALGWVGYKNMFET